MCSSLAFNIVMLKFQHVNINVYVSETESLSESLSEIIIYSFSL